ncbi:enoyl-CoA hydratase-related protein [Henriciella sp. AS95]|uniref:enoyl-CoA hydratase/isomerase family protein n=1 Tax=Henriciella sp. AS95 TaxID=3135782 RepID=UPI00317E1159
MPSSDLIFLTVSDGIAELVLNQPQRRNALSAAMWNAIPDLIAEASGDPEVRTLIVHGGETGHFAAGADISEFETVYATPESSRAYSDSIARGIGALAAFPKPSIAAIEGACVGGGVSLAVACDLRVASSEAKFAVTPGKLGLVYPVEDVRRLSGIIGPASVKDVLFTGRLFHADEAKALGLTDRTCEPGTALDTARTLAAEMMATSQWSLQATKQMISLAEEGRDEEGLDLFLSAFDKEDFREGYSAFLGKRRADFKWRG